MLNYPTMKGTAIPSSCGVYLYKGRFVLQNRYTIPQAKRRLVYDKFNGHCAYCGCKIDYCEMAIDHFLAFSKNGKNNIDNLLPSCNLCNAIKFNSSIEEFREKLKTLPINNLPKIKLLSKYYNIIPKDKHLLFYFEKYNKEY